VIWTIAWRNIWRNKKRSGVLLVAIAFGLWAGLLTSGLLNGMAVQMSRSTINERTAHIQIHAPGFMEHPEIGTIIPNGAEVLAKTRATQNVAEAAGRAVVPSMGSSATTGAGITLYGIDPDVEARIFTIDKKIVKGRYLDKDDRNGCLVGAELADKLKLDVGNKIVVQAQALDGTLSGGAFRIVGIYRTVSSSYDKVSVFARTEDVDRTFSLGGAIQEIVIRADTLPEVPTLTAALATAFPSLDVEPWNKIEPEVELLTSSSAQMGRILLVLIMLALVFGITNTMLMGVLERTRELGVLVSLGMKQRLVFGMIMIETVMLSVVGGALGAAAGGGSVALLGKVGLNLGVIATGMAAAGVESVLYPQLAGAEYAIVGFLVLGTALLGAIYPSIKASRLSPVRAMRTY
jgi:putative ABC transport system permease protein